MAVDEIYDINTVIEVTDAPVATLDMAQNMSKFPAAVWFQDEQPDPAEVEPDLIWHAGAFEPGFANPKGTTRIWMAPAGNAPFTRMKILHA